MPEIPDDAPATPRSRLAVAYAYALLAAVTFIILGIPSIKRHVGDWEVTYLLSARHLWNGQSIYHRGDGYIYPPFPALLALPFAYLPWVLPKLLWYLVTVGCFVLLCRFSWKLAGGPPLRSAGLIEHLAFFVGLIPGATYAFNCISHSQSDILIGCAIITGCVALTRGKSFVAATLYGFAAAMKGPALIWMPYLIWRRRPGAAVWVLAVFLGLNLAPNLISLQKPPGLLLGEFTRDYLVPKSAGVYPSVWFTESNQSLAGSLTRWKTGHWEWIKGTPQPKSPREHPVPLSLKFMTLAGYAMLLVTLGIALEGWPTELDSSPASLRPGLEFSMVAMLMLICSPMAAKAQWGVLMLPGFCLARLCITRRDPVLISLFSAGLICWSLSQNWIGVNRVFFGLWYGSVLWNAVFWYVGCAYAIRCIHHSGNRSIAKSGTTD